MRRNVATMEYEERESLKYTGWRQYRAGVDPGVRAAGLEMVIRSHWERSRNSGEWIRERDLHPDYATYAGSWLNAMGDHLEIVPRVLRLLVMRYRFPCPPLLKKGCTYISRAMELSSSGF